MEGAVVIKVDTDDSSEMTTPTSASPDGEAAASNGNADGKATESSGRKTPDTPTSDTPTSKTLSTGEGEGGDSLKLKRKAAALLGLDDDNVNKGMVGAGVCRTLLYMQHSGAAFRLTTITVYRGSWVYGIGRQFRKTVVIKQ